MAAVGGTPGDSQPRPWASSLQATCDCLSWRGVVDNVNRRQREDELTQKVGTELGGEMAQLITLAEMLLESGIIADEQLTTKMRTVRERFEQA
jgi:hypothetical protein